VSELTRGCRQRGAAARELVVFWQGAQRGFLVLTC